MSDLQISLLIIGAVVVGAVYLFNWMQERKFRRKLGDAFGAERDDVLLKPAPKASARVEPQLARTELLAADTLEPAAQEARDARRSGSHHFVPAFDSAIEYVAEIVATTPVPDAAIEELLARMAACGKPYRAAGLRPDTGEWEELPGARGSAYARLALALQLVTRNGPVSAAQLAMFCDAVRSCAARVSAVPACPDTQAALKIARELDEFCAEVDVAIGVNIVANDGQTFPGTKIRALAEAQGFKLEPDGLFHFRNEQRQSLFTLDNHEPAPFLPEQISSLSTSGITLLLDVPRVAEGPAVLDRMISVARTLAQSLGGRLVDDNRVALNDAGIARIRSQLADLGSRMEAFGISAGGARALRLFS